MLKCGICDLIQSCKSQNCNNLMLELPNSYVILGKPQFYKGYCILLFKGHKTELFHLAEDIRNQYVTEINSIAKVIFSLYHPDKINYAILGNEEPHIHCHVIPRYKSDEYFKSPIWLRPDYNELQKQIISELELKQFKQQIIDAYIKFQ